MRKMRKIVALTMCASMLMAGSVSAETFDVTYDLQDGDTVLKQKVDREETEIDTCFSKNWSQKIQVEFNLDKDAQMYVKGTIGYSRGFLGLFDKDYVTNVGGTSHGYKCHSRIINSDGDSEWTGWIGNGTQSGKVQVSHTGSDVTYRFRCKNE